MTPGIIRDRLDEFTRLAVPLILGRFPDWERYAVTTPDGCVRFAVPCPSPTIRAEVDAGTCRPEFGGLCLEAHWTRELWFQFHVWHCYYAAGRDMSEEEAVSRGLDLAVDLVSEDVGVITYFAGGGVTDMGTAPLPAPVGWEVPIHPWHERCDRVTLRTWSGNGDRDWPTS